MYGISNKTDDLDLIMLNNGLESVLGALLGIKYMDLVLSFIQWDY